MSKDQEIDNIFTLHDPECTGYVEGSKLADMLRACGIVPSPQEEQHSQQVTKDSFRQLVNSQNSSGQHSAHHELVAALKMFDASASGIITTSTMRNVLCNLGQALPQNDVETIIQKMEQIGVKNNEGDVEVSCDDFASVLLAAQ